MTEGPDLFGHAPAQGNLFGEGADRMAPPRQASSPDPETIRRRLSDILETARAARVMPWSERDARMWRTVFPNMTKWLPPDEAEQLRKSFDREIRRLKAST